MTLKDKLRLVKNFPRIFKYDFDWTLFQLKYSNLTPTKEAKLAALLVVSHVLEKGLTMPKRRLGFGQSRVRMLIEMLNDYIQHFNAKPIQVQSSLNDLAEYLFIHEESSFPIPDDIKNGIVKLLKYRASTKDMTNLRCTKDAYFVTDVNFEKLAYSRRSLRYYDDSDVEMERLIDALRIAQTAPSACNRQSTRVKIIDSQKAKDYILKIHNGTRGFGHLANKILLITSDMTNWAPEDRNMAFLDAGIYTMNLLYALHHKSICACPLNAGLDSKQSSELRKTLSIPESEIPICFITIGNPPDDFLIAKSERLNVSDIYTII